MRPLSTQVVVLLTGVLATAATAAAGTDAPAVEAARQWRQSHESALLAEYFEFLRLPNSARDAAGIRRNAEHLLKMMDRRGLSPRLLEGTAGPPLVYGELLAPGATTTFVFYSHYDGQPVDAAEWATPPFEPTLRDGLLDQGGTVITGEPTALRPDWRLYARSASDAKAPIMAMLAALDVLRAAGVTPRANLKFVFDGEEEIGSPHLADFIDAHGDLLRGDLWLVCDGPMHASGAPTVVFGVRGVQGLEITLYGASRELHSGHYGNWAPNPAMMLSQLLASMKDADGRVLVKGFYDGVVPLSKRERQALAALPDSDAEQRQSLGLARSEGGGKRLAELITLPALNVRGVSSGFVGAQTTNAIPATAVANVELRLVKGMKHEQAAAAVIEHVRRQGYHVVSAEPDAALRLQHPRIAKVIVDPAGYDAVRTSMDLPRANAVVAAVRRPAKALVLMPTMGGSIPFAPIEARLGSPMILVPIVNHDNSQHAKNENLRLGHLWDGIETMAALLTME
jgi:acetylornithine deacetylase/succinyl-diaminopimelate desuccinylase-like protein